MANNAHYATAYTGGGNALDGIVTPTDGDLAFVTVDGYSGSMHRFNSGNTGSENSPWIILPDDSTTGAWEMIAKTGDHVQTVSKIITAASIYSNPSIWTDATNWDVSITPKLSGSIIRVSFDIHGYHYGSNNSFYKIMYNVGGGSYVDSPLLADAAGSRVRCAMQMHGTNNIMLGLRFDHSPTYTVGQALNYKLQIGSSGTASVCLNRKYTDTDSSSYGRDASTLTAEEFAG